MLIGGLVSIILVAACGKSTTKATGPASSPAGPTVTLMTRNMYFGADLSPLFNATSAQLGPAATAAYQQLQASAVADRIEADSHEIATAKPDLVALQEAVVWSTVPSGQQTATVQYDFVNTLLSDLTRLGAGYTVASTNDGFSGALPVPDVGLVGLQDRDVILLRDGSAVTVSAPRSGVYQHALTVTVAGIPITVKRGWTAVDAAADGRRFTVIATHLEAYSDPTRDAQARELLALVSAQPQPTVVAGDVNSPASGDGSQTYNLLRNAGLGDAWAAAKPTDPGYTCCRDGNLRTGTLTQRIDMVFYRGAFNVTRTAIAGATPDDRTPGGLWPSDHAAVVAALIPPTG